MSSTRLIVFATAVLLFLAPLPGPLGAAVEEEKVDLEGYAEYRMDGGLIVEGQRVVAGPGTRVELPGRRTSSVRDIPLGYEVEVDGRRQKDGVVRARKVKAKPNGSALFESQVVSASDEIEQLWVSAGRMFAEDAKGRRQDIGEIVESGPEVARVRRIMANLVPPYIEPSALRVRVVDTDQWNASAMGNGAIWVYRGLLEKMSDDEIAVILGHELAHYSHEHSRRSAKKGLWGQIAGLAGLLGAQAIDNRAARTGATLGSLLSVTAWQTGYSRDLEDQADRVGLRYAHEGGYDVSAAPRLWNRFREKYGERGSVTNFFFGSHSRPSDRIRNIERELERNYN